MTRGLALHRDARCLAAEAPDAEPAVPEAPRAAAIARQEVQAAFAAVDPLVVFDGATYHLFYRDTAAENDSLEHATAPARWGPWTKTESKDGIMNLRVPRRR